MAGFLFTLGQPSSFPGCQTAALTQLSGYRALLTEPRPVICFPNGKAVLCKANLESHRFSTRRPSGVSTTTFKIGTGLYFIVMVMISSAIGGYLAGRLRTKWTGVHSDEVYFRDTAHGFLAWAFASVLGAVLLASPATSLIGGPTVCKR